MLSLAGARSRLALLALGALLSAACQNQSRASDFRRDNEGFQVAAVEVVQVREGALPLTERLTGTVRAAGEVGIFPEVSAPVAEVYVDNGDDVRRGDPLVPVVTLSRLAQQRSESRDGHRLHPPRDPLGDFLQDPLVAVGV